MTPAAILMRVLMISILFLPKTSAGVPEGIPVRRPAACFPPYRGAVTPLNSSTPIAFHSMEPIRLSGISIIISDGFIFFDGNFLRMIS